VAFTIRLSLGESKKRRGVKGGTRGQGIITESTERKCQRYYFWGGSLSVVEEMKKGKEEDLKKKRK